MKEIIFPERGGEGRGAALLARRRRTAGERRGGYFCPRGGTASPSGAPDIE